MQIKALIDEDFINFKKCSMFIGFPTCSWKCGKTLCQNSALAKSKNIKITSVSLVTRYLKNPLSQAIVCGGLEPIDSFNDLIELITSLRAKANNDYIVIYSGYNKNEIEYKIAQLQQFNNIIVKFGRYIPDSKPHFDNILGVMLQSENQYAEVIS